MQATWLADVLRADGIKVFEHPGWKARGHGDFIGLRAVVWHHDASPVGPSPGVPGFMLSNWDKAAANCWVALDGTWHILAAGISYHAGKVLPGKPGNRESLGIETDHTTGETWSGVLLLESLRRGTAAILRRLHRDERGLEFHKSVCSPPGRKTDPDGLVLPTERTAVARLLQPLTPDPGVIVNYPEEPMKRIAQSVIIGPSGQGWTDVVGANYQDVISVFCNTANPPDRGYKAIPDVAVLDVAGRPRVVVEEAVPGTILVTVWCRG